MKAYIITEAEMENLHLSLEKAFRDKTERHGQPWNTSFMHDKPPSIYDNFKTANYVFRVWVDSIK